MTVKKFKKKMENFTLRDPYDVINQQNLQILRQTMKRKKFEFG